MWGRGGPSASPPVGAFARPRHSHPVTRRSIWRPIRKFWPCAESCTRGSIQRPGVGRAWQTAILLTPRNYSACQRSPAPRLFPEKSPALRKSCRSSGRPSLLWACCRRKTISKCLSRLPACLPVNVLFQHFRRQLQTLHGRHGGPGRSLAAPVPRRALQHGQIAQGLTVGLHYRA